MGETAGERACPRHRARTTSRARFTTAGVSRGRVGAWLLALLSLSTPASAAGWVPNEPLVSSQIDLIDPEYSQSRAQFVWNDELGNLWVGNVDLDTGNFVPWDGKGILVDLDSMTYADKNKTWNGPEWISTPEGDHILYTKFKGRH